MHADLEHLIELQSVDAAIARLNAEIAALPRRMTSIETKLNGAKTQVEKVKASMQAGDKAKRGFESDIQARTLYFLIGILVASVELLRMYLMARGIAF